MKERNGEGQRESKASNSDQGGLTVLPEARMVSGLAGIVSFHLDPKQGPPVYTNDSLAGYHQAREFWPCIVYENRAF